MPAACIQLPPRDIITLVIDPSGEQGSPTRHTVAASPVSTPGSLGQSCRTQVCAVDARVALLLGSLSTPLLNCWNCRESRLCELEQGGEQDSRSTTKSVARAEKGTSPGSKGSWDHAPLKTCLRLAQQREPRHSSAPELNLPSRKDPEFEPSFSPQISRPGNPERVPGVLHFPLL
jgi:hypothetical protein